MFRVAAAAVVLCFACLFTPATAHEASQRVASLALDIPGLTYPRAAPPDLVAPEMSAEIGIPDAVTAGATAALGEGPPATTVTLQLEVDLTWQQLTVQEGDEITYVWPISSDRTGHVTPPGALRPQQNSCMWSSRKSDLAPMPHAVFFNGVVALHAMQGVHALGRHAALGCIPL